MLSLMVIGAMFLGTECMDDLESQGPCAVQQLLPGQDTVLYCPEIPEVPPRKVCWSRVDANGAVDVLSPDAGPDRGHITAYDWYGGLQIEAPDVSDAGRYYCVQEEASIRDVTCVDYVRLKDRKPVRLISKEGYDTHMQCATLRNLSSCDSIAWYYVKTKRFIFFWQKDKELTKTADARWKHWRFSPRDGHLYSRNTRQGDEGRFQCEAKCSKSIDHYTDLQVAVNHTALSLTDLGWDLSSIPTIPQIQSCNDVTGLGHVHQHNPAYATNGNACRSCDIVTLTVFYMGLSAVYLWC